MTPASESVVKAALSLSKAERMDVIVRLLDVDDDGYEGDPAEIDAAWVQEADRRYQALKRGESTGVPVEEVLASLRRRGSGDSLC